MVPRASLRAFQPLDAFPAREREWWASCVSDGRGLSRTEALAREEASSAARLLTGRGPFALDAALIRRVGTTVHLCPLQLDLRAAVALRQLRLTVPDEVIPELVPDERTREHLDTLAESGQPAHVLDASWVVPLEWFLAFEPQDRRFLDHPEGRGPRIVYLTRAGEASLRLRRVIEVIESTIEDSEDMLAAMAGVDAWVDAFHRDALIELDYGTVAGLFRRGELERDHSCEDLWAAVEALASGDVLGAVTKYGVVRARWGRAVALQTSS